MILENNYFCDSIHPISHCPLCGKPINPFEANFYATGICSRCYIETKNNLN